MGFDSFPKESIFSVAQSANAGLPDSSAQTSSDTPDRRLSAPAALRNREFIAEVLKGVLPEQGTVLEIASGTGEHVSLFAATFPDLTWQPSDIDTQALASIEDWVKQSPLKNLLPPVTLNVEEDQWPLSRADAIININMIHISPYTACEGLMKGASRTLPEGGVLVLYGPFKRNGVHTAVSNEQFDASLRMRNRSWGVRDVAEVAATASSSRLKLKKEVSMPANNLVLVFQKQSSS
jgi:cyclopropane fatty-acyl-phospholipid synthase-like methyltransferase